MNRYKKIHKVFRCLVIISVMAAICVGLFAEPVQAAGKARSVIRVGCYEYEGMIEKNEDGTLYGYGVDYLERIAEYTGWKYEFVCADRDEVYEMLKNGEVDMLCGVPLNTEFAEIGQYSASPLVIVTTCLYVCPKDERYYYEDFDAFDGMKIGILDRQEEKQLLNNYAELHGFRYETTVFEDMKSLFGGLDHDQVDGVFTIGQEGYSTYRSVAQAGMLEMYCLFGKGSAGRTLLLEWDNAVMRQRTEAANFSTELYKKYYSITEIAGSPTFTREEAEYIKNSGRIAVGMMKNRPGLSFYKEGEGYSGIMANMAELIEERSGLTFEYVELQQGERAVDFIDSYGGEAIVPLMISDILTISDRLRLIRTGVESGLVPVGRKNHEFSLNDKLSVALAKSFFGFEEHIREMFPNAKVVYYENTKSCLNAVAAGEADITFGDIINLNVEWADPHLDQLYVLSLYYYQEELVMALGDNTDPVLLSILQKTMDALGADEKGQILLQGIIETTNRAMSFAEFVYRYQNAILAAACLLVVLFAGGAIVFFNRRKSEQLLQKRNGQLREAMEQVESANMAKTSFLARVSHEIRTPLNAIVGITTLAERHMQEPSKLKEDLRKIQESSKILVGILNDVLDMSAIEKNLLRIGSEPFVVEDVLNSVQSVYEPLCLQKDIEFAVEKSGDTGIQLEGDSLRLTQVLNNLLSNALKFTDRNGRIRVTLQMHPVSRTEVYADFSVEDTGCGISEEMLTRVFEPFQQENPDVARVYGGSGLGLSICKNLVELMHGSIQVESTKNVGTCFRFSVPFNREGNETEGEPDYGKTGMDIQGNRVYNFNRARVLLAEDNEINREIASELLKIVNLDVTEAVDGEQALALFKKSAPGEYALILTDIQMPNMSGHDLARKIRSLNRSDAAQVSIFAMTANAFREDIALAMAAGMNGHIAKPIEADKLYQTIAQVLQKGGAANEV